MIMVRTNKLRVLANLRAMRRAAPSARRVAIAAVVRDLGVTIVATARHDTNRFRAAWAMACNDVAGGVPVPPYRASKYWETFLVPLRENLERQTAALDVLIGKKKRWYDSKPGRRHTAYYHRLEAQIARRREAVLRGVEMLRRYSASQAPADRAALLLDAGQFSRRAFDAGVDKVFFRRGAKPGRAASLRQTRLFSTPLGGRGSSRHGEYVSVVRLENLEPHARIVEARDKTMAKASVVARRLGLRKVRGAYTDAIRRGRAA